MGYTLELWAVRVGDVEAELATPTHRSRADDDTMPEQLWRRWDDLAAAVAAKVASGGAEAGGDEALYVHAVVRALGHHYGALDHTSAGGEEFRRRFLPGPAADVLGRDFVARLVNRPIAGLTWADYPLFGWASAAELREAAAHADAAQNRVEVADHNVEPLHMLVRAVRQAARVGIDLVSAYG